MGTRLFVGNLPYSADEDQLRALFEQDGRKVVDVQLITDRATGRPRGFGFVDLSSQEEAESAIRALNGQEFGGRSLTVNEARERSERPRDGGGRGGFGGGYGNRF
jgi:RNA recognition motif-containing protein